MCGGKFNFLRASIGFDTEIVSADTMISAHACIQGWKNHPLEGNKTMVNTLTCVQSPRSPHGNSPKGCGNSHVTPSNATTTDTIFNYGYRRFYRCIVRFLWVVGAKVPWSSNWASKKLRNRKRVTFFNTWPVLSTS